MPACKCSERRRPTRLDLPRDSNERPRQWVVTRRNWAASAFEGYVRRWSAVSSIACRVCGAWWQTRMDVSPFSDAPTDLDVFDNSNLLPAWETLK